MKGYTDRRRSGRRGVHVSMGEGETMSPLLLLLLLLLLLCSSRTSPKSRLSRLRSEASRIFRDLDQRFEDQ